MRIATWNVNGLRARLDFVRHWLEAREPDVVGLQELKLDDGDFPHDAFAEIGYRAAVHGQKSWNGVAVLARQPVHPVERGLPGQETLGARYIAVELDGLVFASVYCPNGKDVDHPDYDRKLAWLDALAAHWRARYSPQTAAVLGGDFNVVPSDLDSHHADGDVSSIFHTPAERDRFQALQALGLDDLFRTVHPEAQQFSWWDYRGGAFHKNLGLRIDFLLGTESVRRRVRDVVIDRDYRKKKGELKASDHAPVYADLD